MSHSDHENGDRRGWILRIVVEAVVWVGMVVTAAAECLLCYISALFQYSSCCRFVFAEQQ